MHAASLCNLDGQIRQTRSTKAREWLVRKSCRRSLNTTCLSTNGHGAFMPIAWPPLPRHEAEVSLISPPPPVDGDIPAWTSARWASALDVRRRIFCNRSLNMRKIKAVGFDMDWTLAQYKPERFEQLTYTLTINKLVKVFGYPECLYDLNFDWRWVIRGLTIDKKRGNIIKLDRHKYVKIAYHGFRELPREERLATYNESVGQRQAFEEPDYALIDTLFSLAEAFLFMQLVEIQDAQPGVLPAGKQYADLYRDVRAAVDLCHRDGSLKREVASDPGKYIHKDAGLLPMLQMLRDSGRQLFLATNSLWDYTHVVMNFLLNNRTGADRNDEWLSYFDVVITGCGKPAFFSSSKPLFEVHTSTGMLYNTEGGSPMIPIGEADLPTIELSSTAPANAVEAGCKARVFQGGNYLDLHKMLGVMSGSQVLYVGDHIYGDILRSKKTLGWRTMLVVPELERELLILSRCKGNMQELYTLRQHRAAMDDQIQRLQWALKHRDPDDSADDDDLFKVEEALDNLKKQRDEVREKHRVKLRLHHEQFHRVWGQLLKTGYQNSQLAHQMERFACVYTSHVGNLRLYSPDKSYRARVDAMAHEEVPWYNFDDDNDDANPRRATEADAVVTNGNGNGSTVNDMVVSP